MWGICGGKRMPKNKRVKTKYPGVFYIETPGGRKYYIRYRRNNKMIEEKTRVKSAAKANQIRVRRLAGEPSNNEKREAEVARNSWTIERLAQEYFATRSEGLYLRDDRSRFKVHLKRPFGRKTPGDITPTEVINLRKNLLKRWKPATVKHVLNLLQRIVKFGVEQNLCESLGFKVELPKFDNKRTEYLTPEQVSALIKAVEEDEDPQARGVVLTALFTGLRRGAIFKLQWEDLDFERGLIFLREPKGGKTGEIDIVPMNSAVRNVFENHPRNGEPYVFPGRDGGQRIGFKRAWNRIRKRAGLPENFRFHGLRHAYASLLASSGKVDIYMLQKLLTHRTPEMTQRYAHLLDSALRDAAERAGEIISQAATLQSGPPAKRN